VTEKAHRISYLKTEEQGDKKCQLSVNGWLVSTLAWPRSVPDQHSLPHLHTKFLPNSSLSNGSPFPMHVSTCTCVCTGGECSSEGQTSGRRIHASAMPATGTSTGVSVITSKDQAG